MDGGKAPRFKPGVRTQNQLTFPVVSDNPLGESCYYPDSQKWLVRSPERRLMRSDALDYYDGEE